MHELSIPSNVGSGTKLVGLIHAYNGLTEDMNVEKLFTLQKICYFLQKTPLTPELIEWRNEFGQDGLEAHLQHYGIHRDGSQLLQTIEFADAVCGYAPETEISSPSLYSSMTERDDMLKIDSNPETLTAYIKHNQAIMAHFDNDLTLQEKTQRHLNFLALTYGKIDAIQGIVEQQFSEYQTSTLGNPEGNNKNFIFNLGTKDENVVIRVENRANLGKEQVLQTQEVSKYFSEDYATVMVPFKVDEEINYQPVVISELAKKGDLATYATTLAGLGNRQVVQSAQDFFTQLNDFCLKLMESGHYHPDIKLSNFLTDGERVIVSDRKTIIDKKLPKATEINSSPLYGAPEYQACIASSGNALNAKAGRTTLDMPSYMAYQIGMALKQFMFLGLGVNNDEQKYLEWAPFSNHVKAPTNELNNIAILIQELTRANPPDRLTIKDFNTLFTQSLSMSHDEFMQELERLSPRANLSTMPGIGLLEEALNTNGLSPDLKLKLGEFTSQSLSSFCHDPRANLAPLLKDKALKCINNYLKSVKGALLTKDIDKATPFRKFLSRLRISVPSVTAITELEADLPKIDDMTRLCLSISDNISGIGPEDQLKIEQIMLYNAVPAENFRSSVASILRQTTSPEDKTASLSATNDNGGTMIVYDKPLPLDSGTMVVTESGPSKKAGPNFALFNISDREKISTAPKGTDISSTIKRGDAVQDDVTEAEHSKPKP